MHAPLAALTGLPASRADAHPMSLESLERLYREHFDYVWQSARRLGISTAEADDVVQETFLRIHALLRTETPRNVRAWIFSVLLRVVQHHRRASNRRRSEGDDPIEELSAPARDPEARTQLRETARMLEAVLDELDDHKRAVLILAELEEKTIAEIAEILGINVNTAASRLRFAKRRVAEGIARERARDTWRLK